MQSVSVGDLVMVNDAIGFVVSIDTKFYHLKLENGQIIPIHRKANLVLLTTAHQLAFRIEEKVRERLKQ